ncbi:hypothetical protein [Methanoregula sp.]|uniref:hypothetical protein n=1 Tax=Methanoregula sp. TaxID=2052170 RepID=UPI003BB02B08
MRAWPIVVTLLALFIVLGIPGSAALIVVTSSPQTIVKADTVTFSGTGEKNGSVTLWIIGQNYFSTVTTKTNKQGNFTFVISPKVTTIFYPGQYAFLIQDPGGNKNFEIGPLLWSDGIRIADQGKIVGDIGQISSFPANITPIVSTILNSTKQPDTDDIFTPSFYFVEEPSIHFDRVNSNGDLPDQTTGEALLITGTTNIGPENQLNVAIKNATSGEVITSQNIPVEAGTNSNQWTFSLDEPGLPAGSYIVTISEQKYTTSESASANLNILPYLIAGNTSLSKQSPLPPSLTTYGVLLPLLISCAALAIIGIIIIVSQRK